MNPPDRTTPGDQQLDAQASAFAQLVGLSPNDLDAAYRRAVALGDGLFPHQIEGVAFLLGRRRAILADDMGLGKTRQAIVALRHASPARLSDRVVLAGDHRETPSIAGALVSGERAARAVLG